MSVERRGPAVCHDSNKMGGKGEMTKAPISLQDLLLDWSTQKGEAAKTEPRVKLALTHDEMAQMIGTSRETVTRLFADLKKRQIVQTKGSTLRIRNKAALKAMALTQ